LRPSTIWKLDANEAKTLAGGELLLGGKDSGAVHADAGMTTELAAAKAGARLLPTDSKQG
jgi:hypothetical protein